MQAQELWDPEAGRGGTFDGVKASPEAVRQSSQANSVHKTLRTLQVAVAVLFLCVIGLLVGIIVLGVRHDHDNNISQPTLLSISGATPSGLTNLGEIHAGSGTWVTKASLENATSDLSVVPVNDVAYVIGGFIRPQGNLSKLPDPTANVWIYDYMADTFTAGVSLPTAMGRGAAAVSDSGDIYYIGGRTTDDTIPDPAAFVFRAGQWTALPSMITKRSDFCAAFVGGKLYVFGGYTQDYSSILDSVEVYDPNANRWSAVTLTMPTGRGDVMCAVLDDQVHVVGGVAQFLPTVPDPFSVVANGGFSTEHAVFDFAANTVRLAASTPYARGDAILIPVNSQYQSTLIYAGGETFSDVGAVEGTQIGTHHVSEYLADDDVWVPKAPMSNARFRFGGASFTDVAGDLVVVAFGGHINCHDINLSQTPSNECDEMASVESFIDVDLPHVFMYSAKP